MRPRCLACASCYPPQQQKDGLALRGMALRYHQPLLNLEHLQHEPLSNAARVQPSAQSNQAHVFFSSLLRSTTLIFDSFQRHSFQRQSLKTIFETLLIDNHVILVSNCPHKLVVQGQNMLRIERVLHLPKLNFQNLELTELLTLIIFGRFC